VNYTKPEVAVLGEAASVIELISGKAHTNSDGGMTKVTPAYDLDE
jgi:hypothetical protein